MRVDGHGRCSAEHRVHGYKLHLSPSKVVCQDTRLTAMDIPIRNQVGWTTVVSKKTKKEKAKARATIHEDVEDTRTAISELLELDLPGNPA